LGVKAFPIILREWSGRSPVPRVKIVSFGAALPPQEGTKPHPYYEFARVTAVCGSKDSPNKKTADRILVSNMNKLLQEMNEKQFREMTETKKFNGPHHEYNPGIIIKSEGFVYQTHFGIRKTITFKKDPCFDWHNIQILRCIGGWYHRKKDCAVEFRMVHFNYDILERELKLHPVEYKNE
jgi:hypothetical protein